MRLYWFLLLISGLLCACQRYSGSAPASMVVPSKDHYIVTLRNKGRDTVFPVKKVGQAPDQYLMTELWVSDPECTECKDCFVDSGEVKVPEELNPYITQWKRDLILEPHNNPYDIENIPYARYYLYGYVSEIKYGYPVFFVVDWKRLKK